MTETVKCKKSFHIFRDNMKIKIGLCKGRHDIIDAGETVQEFIFDESIDSPHDFENLYHRAHQRLEKILSDKSMVEMAEFHLFVTGLTSALVSTLQAYRDYPFAPQLILRHFDRDTSTYSHQPWEVKLSCESDCGVCSCES